MIILFVIGWLVLGLGGYFLVRSGYRQTNMLWTISKRNIWLTYAICLGPIFLFVGFLIYNDSRGNDVSSW